MVKTAVSAILSLMLFACPGIYGTDNNKLFKNT